MLEKAGGDLEDCLDAQAVVLEQLVGADDQSSSGVTKCTLVPPTKKIEKVRKQLLCASPFKPTRSVGLKYIL